MNYRIAQEQSYQGSDFWSWCVWIEASQAEMDQIVEVDWFLHPASPFPVIHNKDWVSHFAIEGSGCCVFQLRAELNLAEGATISLTHWLELNYPGDKGETQPCSDVHPVHDIKEKAGNGRQVFPCLVSEENPLGHAVTLSDGEMAMGLEEFAKCINLAADSEPHFADTSVTPHVHWLEIGYPDEEETPSRGALR